MRDGFVGSLPFIELLLVSVPQSITSTPSFIYGLLMLAFCRFQALTALRRQALVAPVHLLQLFYDALRALDSASGHLFLVFAVHVLEPLLILPPLLLKAAVDLFNILAGECREWIGLLPGLVPFCDVLISNLLKLLYLLRVDVGNADHALHVNLVKLLQLGFVLLHILSTLLPLKLEDCLGLGESDGGIPLFPHPAFAVFSPRVCVSSLALSLGDLDVGGGKLAIKHSNQVLDMSNLDIHISQVLQVDGIVVHVPHTETLETRSGTPAICTATASIGCGIG